MVLLLVKMELSFLKFVIYAVLFDSTYETNNHRTTEKEISLADYGFKGNLTISECACGQIKMHISVEIMTIQKRIP